MAMASSRFEEAQSYGLVQLGMLQLSLKEEQKQVIHAFYSGSNVFVWLPTEFGKSECFQTLPFVFDFKHIIVGAFELKCGDSRYGSQIEKSDVYINKMST